jgi:hypothetical protein
MKPIFWPWPLLLLLLVLLVIRIADWMKRIDLTPSAGDLIGVVVGIYLFFGAFHLVKTWPQYAVVSGITGMCVSLISLQGFISEVKLLLKHRG